MTRRLIIAYLLFSDSIFWNSVFWGQIEGAKSIDIDNCQFFFLPSQASFEFQISHLDFVTFDALNITDDATKLCLKYHVRVCVCLFLFSFLFLINAETRGIANHGRETYVINSSLVPSDAMVRVQLTTTRRQRRFWRRVALRLKRILTVLVSRSAIAFSQFTMSSVFRSQRHISWWTIYTLKLPLPITFFSIELK